jgi:hypothetical protein
MVLLDINRISRDKLFMDKKTLLLESFYTYCGYGGNEQIKLRLGVRKYDLQLSISNLIEIKPSIYN